MGVSCLVPVEVAEGKTPQQVLENLQKKIEFLGAERTSNWYVDCETFQANQVIDPPCKLIHLLHTSDYPHLTISVLENNLCLVAENGLDSLVAKLKMFYSPRKSGKIEAKGAKYTMGDFTVKIGNVTQSSNFRGAVIEVTYEPCSDAKQCWNLLTEFVLFNVDRGMKLPPPPKAVVDARLGSFSVADTMLQYVDVLGVNKRT